VYEATVRSKNGTRYQIKKPGYIVPRVPVTAMAAKQANLLELLVNIMEDGAILPKDVRPS
jgi:hypothetical protein